MDHQLVIAANDGELVQLRCANKGCNANANFSLKEGATPRIEIDTDGSPIVDDDDVVKWIGTSCPAGGV